MKKLIFIAMLLTVFLNSVHAQAPTNPYTLQFQGTDDDLGHWVIRHDSLSREIFFIDLKLYAGRKIVFGGLDTLEFPSFVINPGQVSHWNTAYSWGDHSGLYVPMARTWTINGVTQSGAANRTWTVGDVMTSSTYSDPSWITSLAWSKITGAPSFLTSEVDGSTTNEIELPSQTGNSGKVLSTNGSSPSWISPYSLYYNTVAVSGGAGTSVYYLTSDKTSSGTALYTTIDAVIPIVNDPTTNYTYGWSYNSGTKALTVTTKYSPGLVVGILTLLGLPQNAPNGTNVQVVVTGH